MNILPAEVISKLFPNQKEKLVFFCIDYINLFFNYTEKNNLQTSTKLLVSCFPTIMKQNYGLLADLYVSDVGSTSYEIIGKVLYTLIQNNFLKAHETDSFDDFLEVQSSPIDDVKKLIICQKSE